MRRATALKRELSTLREQRGELMTGSEPPSPTTNGFLRNLDRLQVNVCKIQIYIDENQLVHFIFLFYLNMKCAVHHFPSFSVFFFSFHILKSIRKIFYQKKKIFVNPHKSKYDKN